MNSCMKMNWLYLCFKSKKSAIWDFHSSEVENLTFWLTYQNNIINLTLSFPVCQKISNPFCFCLLYIHIIIYREKCAMKGKKVHVVYRDKRLVESISWIFCKTVWISISAPIFPIFTQNIECDPHHSRMDGKGMKNRRNTDRIHCSFFSSVWLTLFGYQWGSTLLCCTQSWSSIS